MRCVAPVFACKQSKSRKTMEGGGQKSAVIKLVTPK